MRLCTVLGLLVVVFGIALSTAKRYDGYKVYRVTFERGRAGQVQALIDQIDGVELWMLSTTKGTADVFVAPNVERRLLSGLRRQGLMFSLLNADVQGLIDGTVVS